MMNQENHSIDAGLKRVSLIILTLSSFLTPFAVSSVNIALPSIGKEFAMDAISLSWVPSAYILSSAALLVPFGRIADLYGRKKVFNYGVLTYTVSSFLLALSYSAGMVIGLRVAQGIAAAMIFAPGVAILTSVFPDGERGRVLGINIAAVYIGLSLGPVLGGFLTQHFGWRSLFIFNVPLGLMILFLTFWKLKGEWAESKGEPFDFIGAAVYGLTLISIMYGFSLLPDVKGHGMILFGILGIFALIKREVSVKHPLLNVDLFRKNAVFAFSNLAALINYSATFAVSFLLSLYLQYIKGLTPQEAGLILIAQPTLQAICSPIAGRLSDKVEPRMVASVGMALTLLGLFSFVFLSQGTTVGFIILNLALLGLGFGLFSSPNTNAIMSSVNKRYYGVASATLGTMRMVGQMFSMGIAMLIFSIYIGKVQIAFQNDELFLKSVKTSFMVLSILCFGGIFASLARGKVR
jgi:EmrB/QacA subfamily drug resistance transporter